MCLSVKSFLTNDDDGKQTSTSYEHRWGPDVDQIVRWQILSDTEQIVTDPMEEEAKTKLMDNASTTVIVPTMMKIDKSGRNIVKGNPLLRSPFKQEITWEPDPDDMDYNATFFEHFFPSVVGKAALLDKMLWDLRQNCLA